MSAFNSAVCCRSSRGGRGTAITGSWAKEPNVSSSKNKVQQSQIAKKKDTTTAASSGAAQISCPLCDEICKNEDEFKAHVLKGHDDKPKQKTAAEKEINDIEKESGLYILVISFVVYITRIHLF